MYWGQFSHFLNLDQKKENVSFEILSIKRLLNFQALKWMPFPFSSISIPYFSSKLISMIVLNWTFYSFCATFSCYKWLNKYEILMYKILIRKHQYLSISNRYHTKDFVITMKPQKKYFVSCVNIYLKFKINYELNAICNKTELFSQNRLFITRNHSRFFFFWFFTFLLYVFFFAFIELFWNGRPQIPGPQNHKNWGHCITVRKFLSKL